MLTGHTHLWVQGDIYADHKGTNSATDIASVVRNDPVAWQMEYGQL